MYSGIYISSFSYQCRAALYLLGSSKHRKLSCDAISELVKIIFSIYFVIIKRRFFTWFLKMGLKFASLECNEISFYNYFKLL